MKNFGFEVNENIESDLAVVRAERDRYRAALREYDEWDGVGQCPACKEEERKGRDHKPDCAWMEASR